MRTWKDIRVSCEVLAALRKDGSLTAPVLQAVMRGYSRDGSDYWASELTQEGVSRFIERLTSERKGILLLWLEEATRGLAITAKQRIYEELVAHCDDALARATESGLTHWEAQLAVVEELGGAREANTAFRRAYLTQLQACCLRMSPAPLGFKTMLGSLASPVFIFATLGLPFLLDSRVGGLMASVVIPGLAGLAFAVLYAYVKRVHVPALLRKHLYREAVLWKTAMTNTGLFVCWELLCLWSMLCELVDGTSPGTIVTVFGIGCLALAVGTTIWNTAILRKLRKPC